MNLFSKPKNRWGQARIAAWAVLAAMLAWTLLAAGLTWWSGYKVLSLLDRFELALVPLLAALFAGWLEDHDHREETEQAQRREAEQAAAERRSATLQRVQALLPDARHAHGHGIPAAGGPQIAEAVRAALAELDGRGRGELLHKLVEKGLLSGEPPALDVSGADFSGAVLEKVHLGAACLSNANLAAAQMNGARLHQARLDGASLEKAFLRHADLREAALAGCDLSRARLEHANLEGARLPGANLAGAFLVHASLKHAAGVTAEMLEAAVLVETTLPDGRKLTNAKGREYLEKKEIATLVDRL